MRLRTRPTRRDFVAALAVCTVAAMIAITWMPIDLDTCDMAPPSRAAESRATDTVRSAGTVHVGRGSSMTSRKVVEPVESAAASRFPPLEPRTADRTAVLVAAAGRFPNRATLRFVAGPNAGRTVHAARDGSLAASTLFPGRSIIEARGGTTNERLVVSLRPHATNDLAAAVARAEFAHSVPDGPAHVDVRVVGPATGHAATIQVLGSRTSADGRTFAAMPGTVTTIDGLRPGRVTLLVSHGYARSHRVTLDAHADPAGEPVTIGLDRVEPVAARVSDFSEPTDRVARVRFEAERPLRAACRAFRLAGNELDQVALHLPPEAVVVTDVDSTGNFLLGDHGSGWIQFFGTDGRPVTPPCHVDSIRGPSRHP